MSLSNYNPHSRYKERAVQRIYGIFFWVLIIGASIGVGFWFGQQYAAEKLIANKTEIMDLKEERDSLRSNLTEMRATVQTANTRYENLQKEFNDQMPEGPIRDLMSLVREQLSNGMAAERLSFLIRSARPPSDCTSPDTKRFVVSNPANTAPKSTVSFANGVVLISGAGVSAINENGKPEAWYDPAKAVAITFQKDGLSEKKSGILPLQHSIVVKDREYRFTIESGAKSFAKVVYDSCAYP